MFRSIKRSFREHVNARNSTVEDNATYYKESTPSRSDQNVAENPRAGRRPSHTSPKPQMGFTGKVQKRRPSRSLSKSRLDLMAIVAESQTARLRLPTVAESGPKMASSDSSSNQAPQHELTELSVPELVKIVLDLRQENNTLKVKQLQPVNPEAQLTSKNTSAKDSAQLEQQKKTLDDTMEQLSTLQEELRREKTRAKEAERSRNRMMKQLALATKLEATFYDDGHFKEAVQQLRWQVYNWVKNRRWEVANYSQNRHHRIVPKVYSFLRTTCPDYHDYVSKRRGMELLIQAHIWQYFGRHVFCRSFWAETRDRAQAEKDLNHNPFSVLKTNLEQDTAAQHEVEFQEWRVASVRLLASRDPKVVDANIAFAAKKILDPLSEDLKPILSGNMKLLSLEDIFRSAIKLDYLLQQQRPYYKFYPVLPDTVNWFVPYSDEKINGPDEDVPVANLKLPLEVKLVVEPGFCKFGDSGGKNYEAESCLLKAEVDFMSETKR